MSRILILSVLGVSLFSSVVMAEEDCTKVVTTLTTTEEECVETDVTDPIEGLVVAIDSALGLSNFSDIQELKPLQARVWSLRQDFENSESDDEIQQDVLNGLIAEVYALEISLMQRENSSCEDVDDAVCKMAFDGLVTRVEALEARNRAITIAFETVAKKFGTLEKTDKELKASDKVHDSRLDDLEADRAWNAGLLVGSRGVLLPVVPQKDMNSITVGGGFEGGVFLQRYASKFSLSVGWSAITAGEMLKGSHISVMASWTHVSDRDVIAGLGVTAPDMFLLHATDEQQRLKVQSIGFSPLMPILGYQTPIGVAITLTGGPLIQTMYGYGEKVDGEFNGDPVTGMLVTGAVLMAQATFSIGG